MKHVDRAGLAVELVRLSVPVLVLLLRGTGHRCSNLDLAKLGDTPVVVVCFEGYLWVHAVSFGRQWWITLHGYVHSPIRRVRPRKDARQRARGVLVWIHLFALCAGASHWWDRLLGAHLAQVDLIFVVKPLLFLRRNACLVIRRNSRLRFHIK